MHCTLALYICAIFFCTAFYEFTNALVILHRLVCFNVLETQNYPWPFGRIPIALIGHFRWRLTIRSILCLGAWGPCILQSAADSGDTVLNLNCENLKTNNFGIILAIFRFFFKYCKIPAKYVCH